MMAMPGADGATWAIPGPWFLVIYAVLFAVTVAVVAVVRWPKAPDVDGAVIEGLGTYDVALLRGGRLHAANVAIISLVRSGTLTVTGESLDEAPSASSTRQLEVTGAAPPEAHPLERVTCDVVSTHDRPTPSAIALAVAGNPAMGDLERSLTDRGLMCSRTQQARAVVVTAIVWVPLAVVGLLRLSAGLEHDRPVGLLSLALLGTGAVALQSIAPHVLGSPRRRSGRVSRRVYEALEPADRDELRAATAAAFGPDAPAPSGLTELGMLGIAVLGTTVLFESSPATASAVALPSYDVATLAPDRWMISAGGAGWSTGGGSDGGCGDGCGGCGGCGG